MSRLLLLDSRKGGVISYYTALGSDYNLGGLMVLSSYLPDVSLIDVAKIQHKLNLPILICHGTMIQSSVNIAMAGLATKHLQQLGLKYDWHEYPMEHSVCYEEIVVIRNWLLGIFTK